MESVQNDLEVGVCSSTSSNVRLVELTEKLNAVSLSPSECCIYKVHNALREVNRKAYEPVLVSIGPYHRGKDKFQMMEHYKLRYLRRAVGRMNHDLGYYLSYMRSKVEEARKCYAEHVELDDDEFAEMLLLDSCFVVEVIREFVGAIGEEENLVCGLEWMVNALQRDLMLFENQLPLFVIISMFDLIEGCPNEPEKFIHMGFWFFSDFIQGRTMLPTADPEPENYVGRDGGKHLLGMLHDIFLTDNLGQQNNQDVEENKDKWRLWRFILGQRSNQAVKENKDKWRLWQFILGQRSNQTVEENKDKVEENKDKWRLWRLWQFVLGQRSNKDKVEENKDKWRLWQFILGQRSNQAVEENKDKWRFIPCASKLIEAGIKFERAEGGDMFDIKFKNGVITIPYLKIDDRTDCFLRNLIAYEQYKARNSRLFVTDYAALLDRLINTSKDVEILSKSDIIDSWLGDDEAVSNLFNKIGDVLLVTDYFPYAGLCNQVNAYYNKKMNRWMAKLKQNYLNSPWAVISVAAAIILLVLTVAQTVAAFL